MVIFFCQEVEAVFKLNSNDKIGNYIKKLIEDSDYKSTRQFCRAYLEALGETVNDDELRKMSNRLSAIKKGKKSIQIKDLPVFTQLFDVSCEEILSAGEVRKYNENHMTNYQIAFSDDEKVWQSYINRDDKLILNSDEYNKTVIDYALEFKNYKFLKYLMENNYIWFVSKTPEKDCYLGFGAGTSIKRRKIGLIDDLDAEMKQNDSLRRKMIALAIENKDFDLLEELRAREIPSMYRVNLYGVSQPSFEKYCDIDIVKNLSNADEKVLDYFSKEIEIKPDLYKESVAFMFPMVDNLIELLIQNNNAYAEPILRRCIEHNKNAFKIIKRIKDRKYEQYGYIENNCEFYFSEDGNIISVFDRKKRDGTVTNIISINCDSESFVISELIKDLNKTYNKILNMRPEKGRVQ